MAENGSLPNRMMSVFLGNLVILTEQLTVTAIPEKRKSAQMVRQRENGIILTMARQINIPVRMITTLTGKEIIRTGAVHRIIRREVCQNSKHSGGI